MEYKVLEGLYGKFIHTEQMSIVRWRFEAGANLPAHNHPHEQVTMLLEGELELQVEDKNYTLKPGDAVPIAPDLSHSGTAKTATVALDIFSPVREDFREKYP